MALILFFARGKSVTLVLRVWKRFMGRSIIFSIIIVIFIFTRLQVHIILGMVGAHTKKKCLGFKGLDTGPGLS